MDLTTLFIDMLNEILSLSHINKCVYDNIKRLTIYGDRRVEVELGGYRILNFSKDVKAVTYHEAEIRHSAAGILQTVIILDI